jgi:L-2-aminoadipate reductase
VAQITSHPRLTFNEYLSHLETYGYRSQQIDYIPWSQSLESFVHNNNNDFALMPLFTFVANDLPSNSRAPELDDANARKALEEDRAWTGEDLSKGSGVTKQDIGMYLAYLVEVGFLPKPNGPGSGGSVLPEVNVSQEQRRARDRVGGRGGLL